MAAPLPDDYFVARVLPAVGHAIFDYITTRDAAQVRACSVECRDAVAGHKWHDPKTPIRRDVPGWRACFPRATAANISGWYGIRNTWVTDADFVHLAGLRELRMEYCVKVTDAAFVHLRGIHTLGIWGCSQHTITDAAFVHLRGIHTLDMSYCSQRTITDAASAHLAGIHKLVMSLVTSPPSRTRRLCTWPPLPILIFSDAMRPQPVTPRASGCGGGGADLRHMHGRCIALRRIGATFRCAHSGTRGLVVARTGAPDGCAHGRACRWMRRWAWDGGTAGSESKQRVHACMTCNGGGGGHRHSRLQGRVACRACGGQSLRLCARDLQRRL